MVVRKTGPVFRARSLHEIRPLNIIQPVKALVCDMSLPLSYASYFVYRLGPASCRHLLGRTHAIDLWMFWKRTYACLFAVTKIRHWLDIT